MSSLGPCATAYAIEALLETSSPTQALSLARATRQIRQMIPNCAHTDEELAKLIASHAVAKGFSALLFDTTMARQVAEELTAQLPRAAGPALRPTEERAMRAVSFLPELRRAALGLAENQKKADQLVERALNIAIATVDHRPAGRSIEDWLRDLLRQVAWPSRRSH